MFTTVPDLSYSTTVPRHLVHRAAVCEVFLTDAVQIGDGAFAVAAQLPRVHSYYSDAERMPASYDPLLLLEAARQAGIYVSHIFFDVPESYKYILNNSAIHVEDPGTLAVSAKPGHATLTLDVVDTKTRDGQVVGYALQVIVDLDGRRTAEISIAMQWMPSEAWDRLRHRGRTALDLGSYDPASVEAHHMQASARPTPATVGRRAASNVVLSGVTTHDDGIDAAVVVDLGHPALFDHPLDHIPGMLIFEALRQSSILAAHEAHGLAATRLAMSRCEAQFLRFGEFELPTSCRSRVTEATPGSSTWVTTEVQQGAAVIARGHIELTVVRSSSLSVAASAV